MSAHFYFYWLLKTYILDIYFVKNKTNTYNPDFPPPPLVLPNPLTARLQEISFAYVYENQMEL